MRLVNLTGHSLRITDGDTIVELPSEGRARVTSKWDHLYDVKDESSGMEIAVMRSTRQQVVDLPEAEDGVVYIVSGIVAAYTDRQDVVAPGKVLRREGGEVVGCRVLVKPMN